MIRKIDGASLHAANRHRNVAMPRHQYDRQPNAKIRQLALKIEAADPRHAYVQDQAAREVRPLRGEKFAH
ncbi:MAG: hypothetical protein WDM89_02760 [Rhizomicrobium sp.]